MSDRVLRVANCSGFYGDRLSAAEEMVHGGPIDVLTGDYLAELTLSILQKDRRSDPAMGYAKTFPLQLRRIAGPCLEKGIKIVVNAGGLNPAGCAHACRAVYDQLGLDARVAHIEGDDLLARLDELQAQGEPFEHLDKGLALSTLKAPILSANAYLGAWGIAEALGRGADLVICPRVTDASLVVGPAAWFFGWARDDWNRLASAVVAGHILECGAQATGGNYAFFDRMAERDKPLGFPWAELYEDGTFTVGKHPGTGGELSTGTVTAQLLYEIDGPRYLNPDVTTRLDTIQLRQDGPDRVLVHGVQGEPPPTRTKVCINHLGGFKNRVSFLLTGTDIEAKAAWVERQLWQRLGGREQFADSRVSLHRTETDGSLDEAFSFLTVAVKDSDPKKVGRRFSSAAVELALASYPGFNITAPPGKEQPFSVYWPALVCSDAVQQVVVMDGESMAIAHTAGSDKPPLVETTSVPDDHGPCERVALGRVCGARSGDKGGNANLGVWTHPAAFPWLRDWLTVERLRELVPDARELVIERHVLANLNAMNFVLHGLLGDGVASSLAVDAQAKGLGEYVRAKQVPVPVRLLSDVAKEQL